MFRIIIIGCLLLSTTKITLADVSHLINGHNNNGINNFNSNENQNFASGSFNNNKNDPDFLRDVIPGEPGVDYPIFRNVPRTHFSCANREFGYYADVEAKCQVFRICSDTATGGQGFSFLCPNGTLFNQRSFVCDWYINVDCQSSEQYYGKNAEINAKLFTHAQMMASVKDIVGYTNNKAYSKTPIAPLSASEPTLSEFTGGSASYTEQHSAPVIDDDEDEPRISYSSSEQTTDFVAPKTIYSGEGNLLDQRRLNGQPAQLNTLFKSSGSVVTQPPSPNFNLNSYSFGSTSGRTTLTTDNDYNKQYLPPKLFKEYLPSDVPAVQSKPIFTPNIDDDRINSKADAVINTNFLQSHSGIATTSREYIPPKATLPLTKINPAVNYFNDDNKYEGKQLYKNPLDDDIIIDTIDTNDDDLLYEEFDFTKHNTTIRDIHNINKLQLQFEVNDTNFLNQNEIINPYNTIINETQSEQMQNNSEFFRTQNNDNNNFTKLLPLNTILNNNDDNVVSVTQNISNITTVNNSIHIILNQQDLQITTPFIVDNNFENNNVTIDHDNEIQTNNDSNENHSEKKFLIYVNEDIHDTNLIETTNFNLNSANDTANVMLFDPKLTTTTTTTPEQLPKQDDNTYNSNSFEFQKINMSLIDNSNNSDDNNNNNNRNKNIEPFFIKKNISLTYKPNDDDDDDDNELPSSILNAFEFTTFNYRTNSDQFTKNGYHRPNQYSKLAGFLNNGLYDKTKDINSKLLSQTYYKGGYDNSTLTNIQSRNLNNSINYVNENTDDLLNLNEQNILINNYKNVYNDNNNNRQQSEHTDNYNNENKTIQQNITCIQQQEQEQQQEPEQTNNEQLQTLDSSNSFKIFIPQDTYTDTDEQFSFDVRFNTDDNNYDSSDQTKLFENNENINAYQSNNPFVSNHLLINPVVNSYNANVNPPIQRNEYPIIPPATATSNHQTHYYSQPNYNSYNNHQYIPPAVVPTTSPSNVLRYNTPLVHAATATSNHQKHYSQPNYNNYVNHQYLSPAVIPTISSSNVLRYNTPLSSFSPSSSSSSSSSYSTKFDDDGYRTKNTHTNFNQPYNFQNSQAKYKVEIIPSMGWYLNDSNERQLYFDAVSRGLFGKEGTYHHNFPNNNIPNSLDDVYDYRRFLTHDRQIRNSRSSSGNINNEDNARLYQQYAPNYMKQYSNK